MKITIFCAENNSMLRQINNLIIVLNGIQNHFFFVLEYTQIYEVNNGLTPINWDSFRQTQEKDDIFRIYITERKFSDNWFSHEERNYSLITISDWEDKFSPPSLRCYLMYQIAQASINFAADINEEMGKRMVHLKPEGCLFDMCIQKNDIKYGMLSGSICPICKGKLLRYGIDENAIRAVEKMLSFVRLEGIGMSTLENYNQAFIVMRYSDNDENDHAYQYGINPALSELGINSKRADNMIQSQQILSQVMNNIKNSRFIIIKVDTDNLNVYFELGLAMGLDKDILLISEKDRIANLPTDLNNFECLTYPKGNYNALKNEVEKFFKDNYHY